MNCFWKIILWGLVSFSTMLNAVVVSNGDVFQLPGTSFVVDSLIMTGGTVIDRPGGIDSWFLQGKHEISGGVIDANLLLDQAQNESFVSGGQFLKELEFDRLSSGSLLTISGGVFSNNFRMSRMKGNLVISGGQFTNFLGTTSLSGGAEPSLTVIGTNWTLGGVLLDPTLSTQDLNSPSGLLSGTLSDGNSFSVNLGSSFDPTTVTVLNTDPLPPSNPVPEPQSWALLLSTLLVVFYKRA